MAISALSIPARELLQAFANFDTPFLIAPLEGQPYIISMKEMILKDGAKKILDEYFGHKSTQARLERGDTPVVDIHSNRILAEVYLDELVRDP